MTTDSAHRGVRLERIENSTYVVTNDRGGQIRIGKGTGTDFTAVDLLLTAIGACTAVDVDILTSPGPNRRSSRSTSTRTRFAMRRATISPTSW